MLNGAVMRAEEKMVYRKKDITEFCKIEVGTEIEWCETGQLGLKLDRKTGKFDYHKGIVVADYEHYIVVRSYKGYNYCLGKNEIAIKQIVIKGFEPHVPQISCYEAEQEH